MLCHDISIVGSSLQITAGGMAYFAGSSLFAANARAAGSPLVSPGCRRSKVKVARIYMGTKSGLWPKPKLNFQEETAFYGKQFAKLSNESCRCRFRRR